MPHIDISTDAPHTRSSIDVFGLRSDAVVPNMRTFPSVSSSDSWEFNQVGITFNESGYTFNGTKEVSDKFFSHVNIDGFTPNMRLTN